MSVSSLRSPAQLRHISWLTVVWALTLAVSSLPDICWDVLIGSPPPWLVWVKVALLAALLVFGRLWQPLRPLRVYTLVLLGIFLGSLALEQVARSARWRAWFGPGQHPFVETMFGTQLQRLIVAGLVMALLLALRYRPQQLFLRLGDLRAPAMPAPWLGLTRPTHWSRFGLILTGCISLGTLTFLLLAGRPSVAQVQQVLPILPSIMVLALMNAFSEEFTYRAALLAPLQGLISPHSALLVTAVLFGIGHYYGVPYGLIGVAMATLLGWLLGKAMLETRGFFWAWCIHFVQDVLIFSFMAFGAVNAGGG